MGTLAGTGPRAGNFQAAIFDMDGVVTRTASLHAAAWKELFDEFLRGKALQPFDARADYRTYVDGKPRREGVRSFLRARGLAVSDQEVEALAARKDEIFQRKLREHGVQTYASTVELIRTLRARGVKTGVVTSSRHGREILQAAGIAALFDARLDGIDMDEQGLKGKPDPDMFLKCAAALGVPPARTLVFEDAVAGVQAGRRGGFGLVVGVDRGGNAAALERAGADLVVRDLAEAGVERLEQRFRARQEEIAWRVEEEGFDPAREDEMESLFAVGNGYLGVRGALDSPLAGWQSDLFIAGVYDRKRADLPYSELEFLAPERGDTPHAELVPLPFPFRLEAGLEGVPLELRRRLDLKRAVLEVEARYAGGAVLRSLRCASLDEPHVLLQEAVLAPQGRLEATLDDPQLAARYPHVERIEHLTQGELELARYRTRASGFEICIASRALREHDKLRRIVCVFTSRDLPDPRAAALARVGAFGWKDFDALLAAHAARWGEFWRCADIRVPGQAAVEQALRFASYHLRSAADHDPRVSVPARALTGRAYEGHIFWDAEIFMLPFYLHAAPALARNLVLYRHSTLEGARRRARELGYRGACFAWESTVTGEDVTPEKIVLKTSGKEVPIFTGDQQVHVTADIAYAVWRYCEATGDEAFLAGPGGELLFESARFWASRAVRGERHYHIRGVVGPDEYHYGVNDNAYTNWMARFNLQQAAAVADRLAVNREEAQQWAALAAALYFPAPDALGVIEQFEGFFALEDYPLADGERLKAPVSRLFEWERINRIKLIKQADVLMLPLLFPDAFSDESVAANYRYYEPLTDHGSSLSPPVHAAIAARIGRREDAERYWKQSLWLDLSNAMHNSALGVHAGAMGGTWQALVFGWLGVRFGQEGPRADPRAGERLPEGWERVSLKLAYRGRSHDIEVPRSEAPR